MPPRALIRRASILAALLGELTPLARLALTSCLLTARDSAGTRAETAPGKSIAKRRL
jgi:hypothetical protein